MAFPVSTYDYKYKLGAKDRLDTAARWLLEHERTSIDEILLSKSIQDYNKFFAISGRLQHRWNNTGDTPADPLPNWTKITRRVLELMGAKPIPRHLE